MSPETILTEFLRDDAGTPLGRGMPSGRPQRADGESHYRAWQTLVRLDPCAFCAGESGTVDHVEPRSRPARGIGSVHGWINTVGACVRCNAAKRHRNLLWFLYQRRWANLPHPAGPAHATRRLACRRPREAAARLRAGRARAPSRKA